jgi:MOSC domain-containing protein YiiM
LTGRIAGIARHAISRGPIETLERVEISVERGVAGNRHGAVAPGGRGRRQVSLIEAQDWAAAMAEVGAELPWWERRANLLVEDFDLPHGGAVKVRIGEQVVLSILAEIDPCERMEELAPGLFDALKPDWRGGAGGKVISGGIVAVGDAIRIEA